MFLLLLLALVSMPARGASEGDFEFEIVGSTGAQITGYTGPGGDVVIPDRIGGVVVTEIGNFAFSGKISLTSVTIPDSVNVIGPNAFDGCTGLKSAVFPANVASIGSYAYYRCTSLTSVRIPNSVTNFEFGIFILCTSLTNAVIPRTVTNNMESAFGGCTSLTKIEVDKNNPAYASAGGVLFNKAQSELISYPLGKIGPYAIPETVNVVRNVSFAGCTGLTSVVIPNSATHLGVLAFSGCTNLTSVTIGNSVTSIGDNAFSNCTRLASVVVPGSVTSFGSYVFADCTSLADAAIPAHVTNNLESAFLRCTGLTQIEVDENNPVYSSVEGVLFDKARSMLILFPQGKAGAFVVPDSVTNIGAYPFAGCTNLTSVAIGSGVTKSLESAFFGCTSLAQIEVDENNPVYSSVEGVLFDKARSMVILFPHGKAGPFVVPDSVIRIQGYAFSGCSSLTSLVMPDSLRSIEAFAFSGCTSLNGVFFQGDAPRFHPSFTTFDTASPAVLYYLPGTTGWDSTVAGRPTAPWRPQMQPAEFTFGARTNQFGFSVTWASGRTVVVEAATNLAESQWSPVLTNTLSSESYYFSDPEWTNHPARFYRVMSQ